jgi:hypothetical protein
MKKITIHFADRNANSYSETRTLEGHKARLAQLLALRKSAQEAMPTHYGGTDFLYDSEIAAIRAIRDIPHSQGFQSFV